MLIWAATFVGRWHFFLMTTDLLDICIFSFDEIMIVMLEFLQNLNSTTSYLCTRAFFHCITAIMKRYAI